MLKEEQVQEQEAADPPALSASASGSRGSSGGSGGTSGPAKWTSVLANALPKKPKQVTHAKVIGDFARWKQPPMNEPSTGVEMSVKVHRTRLVLLFLAMSLFALGSVWGLNRGVNLQQLGRHGSPVPDQRVQNTLDRLNAISGAITSQLVNPVVASVMLILPLLYIFLPSMQHSNFDPETCDGSGGTSAKKRSRWLPVVTKFLISQALVALISAGFSSVYITSSGKTVLRILQSDLTHEATTANTTNGTAAVETILKSFLQGFDATPPSTACAWNPTKETNTGSTDFYDDYLSDVLTTRKAVTTNVDFSIPFRSWMPHMIPAELQPQEDPLNKTALKDLMLAGLTAIGIAVVGNETTGYDLDANEQALDFQFYYQNRRDRVFSSLEDHWDDVYDDSWVDKCFETFCFTNGTAKYGTNAKVWQVLLLEHLQHLAGSSFAMDGTALWNESRIMGERYELAPGVWMDMVTVDIPTHAESVMKQSQYDLNITTTWHSATGDVEFGHQGSTGPEQIVKAVPRSSTISGLECGASICTYGASAAHFPSPQVVVAPYTTPCIINGGTTTESIYKAYKAAWNHWYDGPLTASDVELFDAFFQTHPGDDIQPSLVGKIRDVYTRLNVSERGNQHDLNDLVSLMMQLNFHAYSSCMDEQSKKSMMVIGYGKRMEADRLILRNTNRIHEIKGLEYPHEVPVNQPFLHVENARKWYSISLSHLQWQMQDLETQLGAECGVTNCQGILYPLESLQQMLVLGEVNMDMLSTDFALNRKKLVTLNAIEDVPDVLSSHLQVWQEDEAADNEALVGSLASLTKDFANLSCSYVAEAYVNRITRNHLYMDKLQQTMYTSAMYYLFQNASVRTINSSGASNTSSELHPWAHVVDLSGSYRLVTFTATVPFAAALQTSIGVALVLIMVVFLVFRPEKRVAVQDPKQVGELVHDNAVYPKVLLTCRVRSPQGMDGPETLEIPVDAQVVEQEIVLKHPKESFMIQVKVRKVPTESTASYCSGSL